MTVHDDLYKLTQEDAHRIAQYGPLPEDEAEGRRILNEVIYGTGGIPADESPLHVDTWTAFSAKSQGEVTTLVDELWPEAAVGFIAAPPKKGKTWIGLSLAISVATGTPFLGRFAVATPKPVLLLALEGHRAAIRGRIGCLARGQGVDPEGDQLENLYIAYKPAGINLSDPDWIEHVRWRVAELEAELVIVDVLRAAAALKENDNTAFSEFVAKLRPVQDDGCSVALLHHFGKLTEITKERTPGERMSGAGAMYGAFDVGVFITGSDDGARKLRVEFETRDLASPETIGVHLTGQTTGVNGGFVYKDTAAWEIEEAPDESDVTANAAEVLEWLYRQPGRTATQGEIALAFTCDPRTIARRRGSYGKAGIEWEPAKGSKPIRYWIPSRQVGLGGQVDKVDTVHGRESATQETLDMQEEPAEILPTMDKVDKKGVSTSKVADLQEHSQVDKVDFPTGSNGAGAPHAPDDNDGDLELIAGSFDLDQFDSVVPATLDEGDQ